MGAVSSTAAQISSGWGVLCNKGGKVCGAAGGVSGKQDGVRWACPDRSAVLTIDAGNSTGDHREVGALISHGGIDHFAGGFFYNQPYQNIAVFFHFQTDIG